MFKEFKEFNKFKIKVIYKIASLLEKITLFERIIFTLV